MARLVLWLLLAALISACGLAPASPTPVETPTPSPSPAEYARPSTPTHTPTPVWFPVTATPTLRPSLTPTATPDLRPGLGDTLFQDDFSTGSGWDLFKTERGSAALGNNTLALVTLAPGAYISTQYNNLTFTNFYLEITAETGLCTGQDEFGLLLRRASPTDFYRFSLSCSGETRLDKLFQGNASSPQTWLESRAIPNAAPSQMRLAVWAVGAEMRFFVNGQHLFTTSDRSLPAGQVGVFVRSAGQNAVSVNFSNLLVRSINP